MTSSQVEEEQKSSECQLMKMSRKVEKQMVKARVLWEGGMQTKNHCNRQSGGGQM